MLYLNKKMLLSCLVDPRKVVKVGKKPFEKFEATFWKSIRVRGDGTSYGKG